MSWMRTPQAKYEYALKMEASRKHRQDYYSDLDPASLSDVAASLRKNLELISMYPTTNKQVLREIRNTQEDLEFLDMITVLNVEGSNK